MTGKERVKRAFGFQNPDRIPVVMFNKDFEEGDVIICDVVKHFGGPENRVSEFGFSWERVDRTMGQTSDIMIEEWKAHFPSRLFFLRSIPTILSFPMTIYPRYTTEVRLCFRIQPLQTKHLKEREKSAVVCFAIVSLIRLVW